MPAFTADPPWCPISYSQVISPRAARATISFDADPAVRQFTFFYKDDLSLSGPTSITYEVTITGTAGNVNSKTAEATFKLIIKNPCIDPAFVKIEKAILLNKIYELYEHDPLGLQFVHDTFTIETEPISHILCGSLVYDSTFMTAKIDGSIDVLDDPNSNPVSYDQASRQHTIYSEDFSLLGLRPYTV